MTEFPEIPMGPPISKENFLKLCKWFEDNNEQFQREYMERCEHNMRVIGDRIFRYYDVDKQQSR